MDLYSQVASATARLFTTRYSTSFSSAAHLLPKNVRIHIYAIYGLVRLADEVVDSYRGADAEYLLTELEEETYAAIKRGYSTNPLIHAFQISAAQTVIEASLLQPFFSSMRMDLRQINFTTEQYNQYIHGSAEVVGLMCLKVFCASNPTAYSELRSGAMRLGAAYQKINFLRDFAHDSQVLGRCYFPNITFERFSEADKAVLVTEIAADMSVAKNYISRLPAEIQPAVALSYRYYDALLTKLQLASVEQIKSRRLRLTNQHKARIYAGINLKKTIGIRSV